MCKSSNKQAGKFKDRQFCTRGSTILLEKHSITLMAFPRLTLRTLQQQGGQTSWSSSTHVLQSEKGHRHCNREYSTVEYNAALGTSVVVVGESSGAKNNVKKKRNSPKMKDLAPTVSKKTTFIIKEQFRFWTVICQCGHYLLYDDDGGGTKVHDYSLTQFTHSLTTQTHTHTHGAKKKEN